LRKKPFPTITGGPFGPEKSIQSPSAAAEKPANYKQFPTSTDYIDNLKDSLDFDLLDSMRRRDYAHKTKFAGSSLSSWNTDCRRPFETIMYRRLKTSVNERKQLYLTRSLSAPTLESGANTRREPQQLLKRTSPLAVTFKTESFQLACLDPSQQPTVSQHVPRLACVRPNGKQIKTRIAEAHSIRTKFKDKVWDGTPPPTLKQLYGVSIPPADLGCATWRHNDHCHLLSALGDAGDDDVSDEEDLKGAIDMHWSCVADLDEKRERKLLAAEFKEIQIIDLISREEVELVENTIWSNRHFFGQVRWLFAYFSASKPPLEFMAASDFLFCIDKCRMLDKNITKSWASKLFLRVNLEEEYAEDGTMVLVEDEDNPDNMFTLSEFMEALIRLAVKKYAKVIGPVPERVTKLFTDCIIKHGTHGLGGYQPFRELLRTDEVLAIVNRYKRFLEVLYLHFASKKTSQIDDSGTFSHAIGNQQFMDLNKFFSLTGPGFSARSYHLCIQMSREDARGSFASLFRIQSFVEMLARVGHIKCNKHKQTSTGQTFSLQPGVHDHEIDKALLAQELSEWFSQISKVADKAVRNKMSTH